MTLKENITGVLVECKEFAIGHTPLITKRKIAYKWIKFLPKGVLKATHYSHCFPWHPLSVYHNFQCTKVLSWQQKEEGSYLPCVVSLQMAIVRICRIFVKITVIKTFHPLLMIISCLKRQFH